jgi:hypothetical protein
MTRLRISRIPPTTIRLGQLPRQLAEHCMTDQYAGRLGMGPLLAEHTLRSCQIFHAFEHVEQTWNTLA